METSKEGCLKGGRANVTSFQVSTCNLQLIHPPLSQFVCDRISVGQFIMVIEISGVQFGLKSYE